MTAEQENEITHLQVLDMFNEDRSKLILTVQDVIRRCNLDPNIYCLEGTADRTAWRIVKRDKPPLVEEILVQAFVQSNMQRDPSESLTAYVSARRNTERSQGA